MPNIPKDISTNIKIDDKSLIKLLLISVALEEIGLSNVLNSESDIIQLFYNKHKCSSDVKFEELLKLNRSISDTLRILLENEKILKEKLTEIIRYDEDQHLNCHPHCHD